VEKLVKYSLSVFVFLALILLSLYFSHLFGEEKSPPQAAKFDENIKITITADSDSVAKNESGTPTFYEDLKSLKIKIQLSKNVEEISIDASLQVVKAEGFDKPKELTSFSKDIPEDSQFTYTLNPQSSALTPGDYKVVFTLKSKESKSVPIKIVPRHPAADLASTLKPRSGYNLLNRRLGGKIESYTSQLDNAQWAVRNVHDGIPFKVASDSRGSQFCTNCGWSSNTGGPSNIVFSFYKNQVATIDTIIIDTAAYTTLRDLDAVPKYVEVWGSDSSKDDKDFKKLKTARLRMIATEQFIDLEPVKLKYLKIVFVDAHHEDFVRVAEIKALEHDSKNNSIVKSVTVNIADPATGTYLIHYTSDATSQTLNDIVDGKVSMNSGWASGKSKLGKQDYLPQDFTFGFKNHKKVHIDSIVIDQRSGTPFYQIDDKKTAWVKKIAIYASNSHPFKDFKHVKTIELKSLTSEQSFKLDIDAKYLKLRVLENFGGPYTSIGEIKFIEGNKPEYHSVMIETYGDADSKQQSFQVSQPETVEKFGADRLEKEPNNDINNSNPVVSQKPIEGTIKPLVDIDFFKLEEQPQTSTDQQEWITLTTILKGLPYITTSLTLFDSNKNVIKKFDPSQSSDKKIHLSWHIKRDSFYYQLKSVPASVVLIWDTSGSMGGRSEKVKLAVQEFIKHKPDDMRVNLIRFGNRNTEVLLKEFSADKKILLDASDGKFKPKGGTPLYDAIRTGVQLLSKKKGNRAIILLSDGADTQSKLKHYEIWSFLKDNKVRIYTIGLGIELKIFLSRLLVSGKQILNNISTISGGKAYFTPDPKALERIYQVIATELTLPPKYLLHPHISRGNGKLLLTATGERISAVSAPTHIELILDASGSMRKKVQGKRRIDIAKKVLTEIITDLPDDLSVALRVYGTKKPRRWKYDCKDTVLLNPFNKLNKKTMIEQINSIEARGTTPIAFSLEKLTSDFAGIKGEKLVILLTDGQEGCNGNPAKTVRTLKKKGLKFRLNIVGFSLRNNKLINSMKTLAKLGGGQYFGAQNYNSLKKSLADAMSVNYRVYDSSDKQVTQGQLGRDPIELPEGFYTIKLQTKNRVMSIDNICITLNQQTVVELKKEGEEVAVTRKSPKEGLCQ